MLGPVMIWNISLPTEEQNCGSLTSSGKSNLVLTSEEADIVSYEGHVVLHLQTRVSGRLQDNITLAYRKRWREGHHHYWTTVLTATRRPLGVIVGLT